MRALPGAVLGLAEDLHLHLPLRPGDVRIEDERFVLFLGAFDRAHWSVVQRLRLRGADVAAVVREVRAQLRARGRSAVTWEVGPSATPEDLPAQLLAVGMTPYPGDPTVSGMVLSTPLARPAPSSMRVARVTTFADFRAGAEIFWRCFGGAPADAEAQVAVEFARYQAAGPEGLRYLATGDGHPIGTAEATASPHGLVLSGGATLPEARGQGAYRALLQARWDITLVRLPTYSPDFMPVEALWRWLREEVTYNRCHPTAAALLANVTSFEAAVNADTLLLAQRLWGRTSLDPAEEKLRFSK